MLQFSNLTVDTLMFGGWKMPILRTVIWKMLSIQGSRFFCFLNGVYKPSLYPSSKYLHVILPIGFEFLEQMPLFWEQNPCELYSTFHPQPNINVCCQVSLRTAACFTPFLEIHNAINVLIPIV